MTKKFKKTLVTSSSFSQCPELVRELASISEELVLNDKAEKWDEEKMTFYLSQGGFDSCVIGTEPMTSRVIESSTRLKAVGKYGVGLDNVDINFLKTKGIHFGWTGGVNRRSVSELALGFMLGHQRNIFRSIFRMTEGVWKKEGGSLLTGKTVGIVGLGHIGSDLACLLQPFGCQVLAYDIENRKRLASEIGCEMVPWQELLETSDIISFHVPGGPATRSMFGKDQIERCHKKPLIINTSRGEILDWEAVENAVLGSSLSGLATDVFPNEPFTAPGHLTIERGFYFSPHIGGNAAEAVLAMGRSAIQALRAYLEDNASSSYVMS